MVHAVHCGDRTLCWSERCSVHGTGRPAVLVQQPPMTITTCAVESTTPEDRTCTSIYDPQIVPSPRASTRKQAVTNEAIHTLYRSIAGDPVHAAGVTERHAAEGYGEARNAPSRASCHVSSALPVRTHREAACKPMIFSATSHVRKENGSCAPRYAPAAQPTRV